MTMCQCNKQSELSDISHEYSAFKNALQQVAVDNWDLLMQCPDCKQFWIVQAWDKYQVSYAAKVAVRENWENVDLDALIKTRIIENRGGLSQELCRVSGCTEQRVGKCNYCIEHLYKTGVRI